MALVEHDEDATEVRLSDAERRMVEENLALVKYFVGRWFGKLPDDVFDDYVAFGQLGLIRAVQKFDPSKGFKFSTYAQSWIRQGIDRGVAYSEGIGYRQTIGWNARRGYERDKSRWAPPLSLDHPMSDDDRSGTFGDLIADARVDVEGAACASADAALLVARLRRLARDELDLEVIDAIAAGERMTALAHRLDLDRDLVRSRKERILTRARHPVYGLFARRRPTTEGAAVTTTVPIPTPTETSTNGHPPPQPEAAHEPPAEQHHCDQDGCEFMSPTQQGLGVHRSRVHGVKGTARTTAARRSSRRPRLDTETLQRVLEDGYDPWALIVGVGPDDDGPPKAHTVILSTRAEADQVAALLVELGHKPWLVHLPDSVRCT